MCVSRRRGHGPSEWGEHVLGVLGQAGRGEGWGQTPVPEAGQVSSRLQDCISQLVQVLKN